MTRRGLSAEARFWMKVDGGDVDTCWNWTAAKADGYGQFGLTAQKTLKAHRFAYEQLRGDIPDGLQLDHLCRNRACVNPWHLEPVTTLVNIRRGDGTGSRAECPQGHPYDEANTYRYAGRRYCRTCKKAREAAHKDEEGAA